MHCSAPDPLSAIPTRLSRVLVVDDDATVRTLIEGVLRRSGHEVSSCASGDEALALLAKRASDFEVILLDLTMPGLSGRELLAICKRDHPNVAVVISSGHRIDPSSFRPEPDGVLCKPFRVRELLDVVESALERAGGDS